MRVVAGSARGRRLVAPPGRDVRPTSDRVREALFNSLSSMDLLRDADVLDLFAGSGALGIEALSRGAAHATFVDSAPAALAAVRTNVGNCGVSDRSTIVRADAFAHLSGDERHHDLALLDPPYAFSRWQELLSELRASVAVLETPASVDLSSVPALDPGRLLRQRRYGGTVVTIVQLKDRDEHGRATSEDRS